MSWTPDLPRRSFLKLGASAAAALGRPLRALAPSTSVQIVLDPADPFASQAPVAWAVRQLQAALSERGSEGRVIALLDAAQGEGHIIVVSSAARVPRGFSASDQPATHPESVRIVPGRVGHRAAVWISSAGTLGLVYGLTELADRVRYGGNASEVLEGIAASEETPVNEVRSAARAFCSEVEDKPWFYNKEFWTGYLDQLVTSRFNRFNFAFGFGYDFPKGVTGDYFHFPYPYLVEVPGYDVRVVPLAAGERDRNMETFRFIAAETAVRGLQFQLGIWTHAYQWTDSPKADHRIEGLNAGNHAAYCRDALAILLKECPQITGLTLRVHGESGVPEGSYDFWRTLFQAVKKCGRTVEIDMHAKGINQIMIDMANDTGMPVKVGAKSWAEHMGLGYQQTDIRELEISRPDRMETGVFNVSNGERRFTRYGYADLFQEGRKYNVLFRLWPGTQRHLLWGDPAMAAAYSRTAHFCGAAGLEICEPLTFKGREGSGHAGGRCAYLDKSLEPEQDWQKFTYTYRLWGRLLYNADTPAEVWQRTLKQTFGSGASSAESALASASRVLPLITTAHLPSASNHSFWPELYTNMPISTGLPSPYSDTPTPARFGTVSPLDPQIFSSIEEFVAGELAGNSSPKYSPLMVATWLEQMTSTASQSLEAFHGSSWRKSAAEFRRWEEDLLLQIGLGRFFAAKLRAGVAFEVWLLTADDEAMRAVTLKYTEARDAWATMAQRASRVYVPDVSYGSIPMRRGHWTDRLAAIDTDLAAMSKQAKSTTTKTVDAARLESLLKATTSPTRRPVFTAQHTPARTFSAGTTLNVAVHTTGSDAAELYYRHVNQGERWRSIAMQRSHNGFAANIPADYTASAYPLQYYFVLRRGSESGYHPEFNATLSNQPYFTVWHRA